MTLVIVPQRMEDVPEGRGRRCDRCRRYASWENDVILQVKPTMGPTGPMLKTRCLCLECRDIVDR